MAYVYLGGAHHVPEQRVLVDPDGFLFCQASFGGTGGAHNQLLFHHVVPKVNFRIIFLAR